MVELKDLEGRESLLVQRLKIPEVVGFEPLIIMRPLEGDSEVRQARRSSEEFEKLACFVMLPLVDPEIEMECLDGGDSQLLTWQGQGLDRRISRVRVNHTTVARYHVSGKAPALGGELGDVQHRSANSLEDIEEFRRLMAIIEFAEMVSTLVGSHVRWYSTVAVTELKTRDTSTESLEDLHEVIHAGVFTVGVSAVVDCGHRDAEDVGAVDGIDEDCDFVDLSAEGRMFGDLRSSHSAVLRIKRDLEVCEVTTEKGLEALVSDCLVHESKRDEISEV